MTVLPRLILSVCLVAGMWGLLVHNAGYGGMWFDESVQFWVSRGLSVFAAPFAPPGDAAQVLRWNAIANLDPGGFSLILHYWMRVDTGIVWLRLLPYLWFAVGMTLLAVLAWRLTRSGMFCLLAAAVPLGYGQWLYHASEIRAYSMELTGVIAAAYLLDRALHSPTRSSAFVLGSSCALFLTSRYSFALVTAAAVVTYVIFARRSWLRAGIAFRAGLLELIFPLVIAAGLIYALTLSTQADFWLKGSAVSGAPDYVATHVLARQSWHGRGVLLLRNFLSPAAWPITLATTILLLSRLVPARNPEGWWSRVIRSGERFRPLYCFAAATHVVSALASASGLYPWDIAAKWSLYLLAISALSLVSLAAHAVTLFSMTSVRSSRPFDTLRRTVPGIALGAAILACYHAAYYRHIYPVDLTPTLQVLATMDLRRHSVLVWGYETPTLRYLYESGPFRNDPHYPDSFQLEGWSPRIDRNCLRYAVWPGREDSNPLVAGLVFAVDPAEPGALRRVSYRDDALRTRLCGTE